MLHVMDGGRASPLYRHPVREAVEDYTVNRVYRISPVGLYRVCRVYRVYRLRLHTSKLTETLDLTSAKLLLLHRLMEVGGLVMKFQRYNRQTKYRVRF